VHWTLWILFVGLQIADVVTTEHALALPGNWEANPVMGFAQTHLGAVWWVPKAAVVIFAAIAVPVALQPCAILCVVWYYLIVVSFNLAAS
jgi:hypothetical protein